MQNPKFFGPIYVPEYAKDYHSLLWYEKYLMRYFSYLDYKDMADNPDYYFDDKKVVNFEIIHHQCRGNPLKKRKKNTKRFGLMISKITQKMKKAKHFMQFSGINEMTYGSKEI